VSNVFVLVLAQVAQHLQESTGYWKGEWYVYAILLACRRIAIDSDVCGSLSAKTVQWSYDLYAIKDYYHFLFVNQVDVHVVIYMNRQ